MRQHLLGIHPFLPQTHLQHPPFRHGLQGIHAQVQHGLIGLRRVTAYPSLRGGQLHIEPDARLLQAAHMFQDFFHHRLQHKYHRTPRTATAEGQNALGQRTPPGGCPHQAVQLARLGTAGLGLVQRHFPIAGNRAQHIVEVMGHFARHAPQCFQPLAPRLLQPQSLLRLLMPALRALQNPQCCGHHGSQQHQQDRSHLRGCPPVVQHHIPTAKQIHLQAIALDQHMLGQMHMPGQGRSIGRCQQGAIAARHPHFRLVLRQRALESPQ